MDPDLARIARLEYAPDLTEFEASLLVPDLVDVLLPHCAFKWFVLNWAGCDDFELIEVGREERGTLSEELQRELEETDWESMVHPDWSNSESGEGWTFTSSWIVWALLHGIAPNQPFLMRFGNPRWYECGGYDEREWDVEYDAWFVRTLPTKPPRSALALWERALHRLRTARAQAVEAMRDLKARRQVEVDKMYLRYDLYFTAAQRPVFADMDFPAGKSCSLCTSLTHVEGYAKYSHHELLIGKSDEGGHDKALDALVAAAAEKMPHLSADTIRNLPRRHY